VASGDLAAGERVNAHAAQVTEANDPGGISPGLAAALFAGAMRHPQRTLFRDAGDRVGWSGRPAITWTYGTAAEIVGRLARGLGLWRLPPGSRIGLGFSGGAEACLAHLAVEAAGHVPCPLSPLWEAEDLSAAIEAAGLIAVLTEGRRGARRPATEFAQAAIRHFGLRFIAAFGPCLPDGVISLDAMALERGVGDLQPSAGLITFSGGTPSCPVHRGADALDAAVAAHRDCLAGTDRILTLLPTHDLRGLVTGLGTALASGALLETLLPFDVAAFRATLARPVSTRLVIPAGFEAAVAELPLPWTVRAIDVVHRAPTRLPEPTAADFAGPPRLDVLVLDEDAILTRPRGRWDIPLEDGTDPVADDSRRGADLVRRKRDGRLLCRGLACRVASLQRGEHNLKEGSSPRETTYRLVISGEGRLVLPCA
jgi:hypothetical protein